MLSKNCWVHMRHCSYAVIHNVKTVPNHSSEKQLADPQSELTVASTASWESSPAPVSPGGSTKWVDSGIHCILVFSSSSLSCSTFNLFSPTSNRCFSIASLVSSKNAEVGAEHFRQRLPPVSAMIPGRIDDTLFQMWGGASSTAWQLRSERIQTVK